MIERVFDALAASSTTGRCASSLRFHAVTMAVSVALLVGTVYLFMLVPKGFLPSEDQGRFNISTEAMQGIGFDEMVRHQLQVADDRRRRIRTSPATATTSAAGRGGGGS